MIGKTRRFFLGLFASAPATAAVGVGAALAEASDTAAADAAIDAAWRHRRGFLQHIPPRPEYPPVSDNPVPYRQNAALQAQFARDLETARSHLAQLEQAERFAREGVCSDRPRSGALYLAVSRDSTSMLIISAAVLCETLQQAIVDQRSLRTIGASA